MKKTILSLFVLIALFCSSFTTLDNSNWTLGKTSNGITVYTRAYPKSEYKEFKGVMTVQATMSCLLAVMKDVDNYPNWFFQCPEAHMIKTLSFKEGYNYMTYKVPWPLDSRDMVIHYWVNEDMSDKSVTIKTVGEPNYIAAKADWIRVQELNGFWKFTPKGNGMIEVVYQLHLEPNGSIPAWLANSTVVDAPYNSMLKMKDVIKQAKYSSAKIAEIVE